GLNLCDRAPAEYHTGPAGALLGQPLGGPSPFLPETPDPAGDRRGDRCWLHPPSVGCLIVASVLDRNRFEGRPLSRVLYRSTLKRTSRVAADGPHRFGASRTRWEVRHGDLPRERPAREG